MLSKPQRQAMQIKHTKCLASHRSKQGKYNAHKVPSEPKEGASNEIYKAEDSLCISFVKFGSFDKVSQKVKEISCPQ